LLNASSQLELSGCALPRACYWLLRSIISSRAQVRQIARVIATHLIKKAGFSRKTARTALLTLIYGFTASPAWPPPY
jgi:hypothetical protein